MASNKSTFRLNPNLECESHLFSVSGGIPNHPLFPLIVYRSVFLVEDMAGEFERLFGRHSWGDGWRGGVFSYQHFHSCAHEVLGVYRGKATVRFGGEGGMDTGLSIGDAVVIPAGVGHMALNASADFSVAGAYPLGQSPDVLLDRSSPSSTVISSILHVPTPTCDPILGQDRGLAVLWDGRSLAAQLGASGQA